MKKLDPRIKMLIMAACIAIVHAASFLIFGLFKYMDDSKASSTYLLAVSAVFLAIEITLVIISRIKRYTIFLKGLFLFKLIGVIFFVIAWGISLKNSGTQTGFFTYAFTWFSISTQSLATLISPIVHLSLFFRRGIIFAIMTYVSGAMVSGIRNEQNYEKKMAEKEQYGEQKND